MMDKDYKKAFENILKGKLYYKNGNEYHPANDIIYNHPFIQDLINKAERLETIESVLNSVDDTKAGTGDKERLDVYFKLKKLVGEDDE
jgi:Tfp pilus assembly ATPase PilU